MSRGLKPEKQWDTEDRLDHLDGWHEGSNLGFKSPRDPDRVVKVYGPEPDEETGKYPVIHTHPASDLLAAGRAARERHGKA